MKIILFLILLTNFIYSQEFSIGLNSSLTTNLNEKRIGCRGTFTSNRNSISLYNNGINFRYSFAKIQIGLISTYGQQSFKFLTSNYYQIETQIQEIDQHSERALKIFSTKLILLWQLYKNISYCINIGGLVDWSIINFEDSGLYWNYEQPDNYYKYSDTDKKNSFFFEPYFETQFKLLSRLKFNFSFSYSFKNFVLTSERIIDSETVIFLPREHKYKYSFEGINFGVGFSFIIFSEDAN